MPKIMNIWIKRIGFSSLFVLLFLLMNLFPCFGFEHDENTMSGILQILFLILFVFVFLFDEKRTIKELFSLRVLLSFSLAGFLVISIAQRPGIYATTVFLVISFLFLLVERKFYKMNRIHYVLLFYALFKVIGTIGTSKGFHFPEKYLSFFLVPLAFSCFHFSKTEMLQILRIFIRMMMIYMAFTILYWWYNVQYLEADIFTWLTSKTSYLGKSAFEYSSGWSGYGHPSYVSLVLFAGFISLIYLVFNKKLKFSGFELVVYSFLLLFSIGVMESRIGLVCFTMIIFLSLLYLAYLKKWHFKILLTIALLLVLAMVLILSDILSRFVFDEVRGTYYVYSIEYVKQNIWWGSGSLEQHFALQQIALQLQNEMPLLWNDSYVHNQFLGNMVEYGIWGFLILFVLLFFWFRHSFKTQDYLLQTFLCVILVFMMIEEPFSGQAGITRVVLFFCFFVAFNDSEKQIPYCRLKAIEND